MSGRKIHIGGVTFAVPSDTNSACWEHTDIMGPYRKELLQRLLDDKPIPEPLILIGQVPGGYRKITPDEIDWSISGLQRS